MMKKLLVFLILCLVQIVLGQTVKISDSPVATTVGANDDLIINYWNGAAYVTKRINATNLSIGLSPYVLSTNINNANGTNVILIGTNYVIGAFVGNGLNLTNLSGTNILDGTIHSNKLGASLLTLIGSGGTVQTNISYTSVTNAPWLTNSESRVVILSSNLTILGASNWLGTVYGDGSNLTGFQKAQTNISYVAVTNAPWGLPQTNISYVAVTNAPWANTNNNTTFTGSVVASNFVGNGQSLTNFTTLYNVKDFGAFGNGTASDYVAINAALTAAKANTNKWGLYFPPGTYQITNDLDLTEINSALGTTSRPFNIIGDSARLNYTGTNVLFDCAGANYVNIRGFEVFVSAGRGAVQFCRTAGSANCKMNTVRDCVLSGPVEALIRLNNAEEIAIRDCWFENESRASIRFETQDSGVVSLYATPSFTTESCIANTVSGCTFYSQLSTNLVAVIDAPQVELINNTFLTGTDTNSSAVYCEAPAGTFGNVRVLGGMMEGYGRLVTHHRTNTAVQKASAPVLLKNVHISSLDGTKNWLFYAPWEVGTQQYHTGVEIDGCTGAGSVYADTLVNSLVNVTGTTNQSCTYAFRYFAGGRLTAPIGTWSGILYHGTAHELISSDLSAGNIVRHNEVTAFDRNVTILGTSNNIGGVVLTNGGLYATSINSSTGSITSGSISTLTILNQWNAGLGTNVMGTNVIGPVAYASLSGIVTNGTLTNAIGTAGSVIAASFTGNGNALTNLAIQNYAVYSSLATNATLTNAISTAGIIQATGSGTNIFGYSQFTNAVTISSNLIISQSLIITNGPVFVPFLSGVQPVNAHGSLMMIGDETMDLSAAGQSVYLAVTNYDAMVTNLFTGSIASGVLTNTYAGWYNIRVAGSGLCTTANAQLYEGGLFTNTVECTLIEWQRSVSSTARGSWAAEGTIYLPAGCRVECKVKSDAAAPDDLVLGRYTLTVSSP